MENIKRVESEIINPGPDHYLLKVGDVLREGDAFYNFLLAPDSRWIPTNDVGLELRGYNFLTYRRKNNVICPRCQTFFAQFKCNSPDECDCPKCQGLCECNA